MKYDENRREFVEPELLKCAEPLDVVTMGYRGSCEPLPKNDDRQWHRPHWPIFGNRWR